jgi:hypothetical protein
MKISLNRCPLKQQANKSFVDSLDESGKFDKYIQDALSRKSLGKRLGRGEVDHYSTEQPEDEVSLELL